MTKPTAIAMYVYAGGFAVGMGKHFDVLAHLEDPKPYGKCCIDLNPQYFANTEIIPQPSWPALTPDDKIDLIFANPPCAPFSTMNPKAARGGWRDDSRLSCIRNIMQVSLAAQPTIFLFESVTGIYSKAGDFLDEIGNQCLDAGYSVTGLLHNICHHGSAQSRKRFIFVAHKVQLPDPAARLASEPRHVRHALQDLYDWQYENGVENVGWTNKSKIDFLIPLVQPGRKIREYWLEFIKGKDPRPRGAPSCMTGTKLWLDGHCPTVTGHELIHPTEARNVNLYEMAALADFPPDFKFPDSGASTRFIARGVSPRFADWLGDWVAEAIREANPIQEPDLRIINLLKGQP